MRLQAALLLLASYILPTAWAIYTDEVNHIDYHHALLGIPSTNTYSTFFHKPSSPSNASLLYTLSQKLILGAVNPRDGSIVWRQNISRLSRSRDDGIDAEGFLRAGDGTSSVVSAAGDYVSAWTSMNGRLAWENRFPGQQVVGLELYGPKTTATTRDAIVLLGKQKGVVKRIDGGSGQVKWEFADDSGDIPYHVSSSPTEVFYVSLQSALLKGYKIKVTSLDAQTGEQTQQYALGSDSDVTGPESVLFVGPNTASPVLVWSDKSYKTLKVNVLGSKQANTITIGNDRAEEIRSVKVHASQKPGSLPHFLVQYESKLSSWAEVFHVDPKAGTVSKAYQLPRLNGVSVFATSNVGANVYFTRITDTEISVVSSASHGILGRWSFKSALPDRAVQAVSEVVTKGDNVAVRSAILLASGDWQLIRNGQTEWTRHEALAGAVAAAWAETDAQEELVHELEVEGHESLYGAYAHRVKRHVRDLQYLPGWLSELPKRVITSFFTDEVSNLDKFGITKSVIVATENGQVFSIDTARHGSVTWNVRAVETDKWNVIAVVPRPGSATVFAEDGSSVTLNVASGDIISRSGPSTKIQSIAVVNQTALGIKDDGAPVKPLEGTGFLVTLSTDGRVLGWSAGNNESPVWEFLPPQGEKVVRATARPSHDPVASIGKVLGDRSVLYKYLSPNLVLVTAVGDKSATFYLLDAISGKVLHTTTQTGVDTTQPIPSAISENWFAYSFWGDVTETSQAKGYHLVISELFESPIPNDRGPLQSSSNYSSLTHNQDTDIPPLPFVASQSYLIPEPISHMAVSQTRQGITTRNLLCVLPESSSIIGIPKPILDPRKPVGRDPTSAELEEGLLKYDPFLDFDGRWFISHVWDVAGIRRVLASPTLLESTSVVFAFGGDVFGSRVAPSQAFDILGKGFSKFQLSATVVALGVGVLVLRPIVRRKQTNMLWKS